MVEPFDPVYTAIFNHDTLLYSIPIIHYQGLLYWLYYFILLKQAFNATPASNDRWPSNDRVDNDSMGLDNSILKDNRVDYSNTVSNPSMSPNCNIGAKFGTWVYFSWRVDADQTYQLILFYILRLS